MRFDRVLHLTILFAVFSAVPVFAQDGPDLSPDDEFLENVRESDPASADNKSFDERISTEIKRLNESAGGTNLVAQHAVLNFVQRFSRQYNNEKNSAGFKDKLAERTSLLIVEQYKRGAELKSLPARAMADVLSRFGSVSAREALLLGLKSTDQVVRYRSAKGLDAIIDGVGADARLTEVTVNAIADAAATETNAVVAGAMYGAMRYGSAHTGKVLPALLKALDGRLAQMRKSSQSVDGAERIVIQYLSGLSGLSSDDKVAIVGRVAPLLRLMVEAYGDESAPSSSESESKRDSLEQAIVLAEELVQSLVNPSGKSPGIRSKLAKRGDSTAIDMKIELLLWIGTEQDPGFLNGSPWNVPAGAP